jgi:hypothetical protein
MYVPAIGLVMDQGCSAANKQGAAIRLRERVAALSLGRTFGRLRSTTGALNALSAAASVTFLMVAGDVTGPLPWLTGAVAVSAAAGAEKLR